MRFFERSLNRGPGFSAVGYHFHRDQLSIVTNSPNMPPEQTPPDQTPASPAVADAAEAAANAAVDSGATSAGSTAANITEEYDDDFVDSMPLTPELVEDEAYRGDFVLRWAVVLMAALMATSHIGSNETSTLVHIKTGQYIAGHGFLPPAVDPFSYTTANRSWINLSWGFDLLAAGLYAAGGFAGISLLKGVVAAILFGLGVHCQRTMLPTWWGAICLAAALFGIQPRLTADPTIITLLGTAILLFVLTQREQRRSGTPWILVPMFVIWGNLDARMYLGLGLFAAYALGETISARFARTTTTTAAQGGCWPAAMASVVGAVINPFTYNAWLAPVFVHGTEYPAVREYVGGKAVAGNALQYFPLSNDVFWNTLDLSSGVCLGVLAVAGVTVLVNARRVSVPWLLMYLTGTVLAGLTARELPLAVFVAAVFATWNGQAWYAATFRNEFTTHPLELAFSRGGRAITVAAFAAVAFFSATGKLREPAASRAGLGLDPAFSASLESLRAAVAGTYNERSFNTQLTQGDQLIWLDKRVFADSRVALYYGEKPGNMPGETDNILKQHSTARVFLTRLDRQGKPAPLHPELWQQIYNAYQPSHVVHRMNGQAGDYTTFFDMWLNPVRWRLTSLQGTAAVFHGVDDTDPELAEFLAKNTFNIRQLSLVSASPAATSRSEGPRQPGWYDRYLWSRKTFVPAEVNLSQHYLSIWSILGQYQMAPGAVDNALGALLLSIRNAQTGLARDSNSFEGYLQLALAYDELAMWEARKMQPAGGNGRPFGLRYTQAVGAYFQALKLRPEHVGARVNLANLFVRAEKVDLAERELRTVLKNIDKGVEVPNGIAVDKLREQLEELTKQVDAADSQFAEWESQGATGPQLAMQALQMGLHQRAFELLSGLDRQTTPPQLAALIPNLQLETGAWDDERQSPREAEAMGGPAIPADVLNAIATEHTLLGDYELAGESWKNANGQVEPQSRARLMGSLFPRVSLTSPLPWPLSLTSALFEDSFQTRDLVASNLLHRAQVALEWGAVEPARELLQEIIDTAPTFQGRALAAAYLSELTGTWIDPVSPYVTPPLLFADAAALSTPAATTAVTPTTSADGDSSDLAPTDIVEPFKPSPTEPVKEPAAEPTPPAAGEPAAEPVNAPAKEPAGPETAPPAAEPATAP